MADEEIEIELGDTVKDIHTGFKGVAIAKTEYINGCTQFSVIPKVDKEGKMQEEIGIDIENLVVVKKGEKKDVEPLGGAYRRNP